MVATGGGAVLCECNRKILKSRGCVIHLDSPLNRLLERTQKDKKRPLLKNGDPAETLARLQAEREPLYHDVADYRFITDRQGPKILVKAIVARLEEEGIT